MRTIPVWDIFVRVTHWSVAFLVIGELTVFDEHWAIHRYAGYAIAGFVALRLIWGLVGTQHARFGAFPPSVKAARAHLAELWRGEQPMHVSHNPLGALMVYNLWISLIAVCTTGILQTTTALHGADWLKGMHEILANWILICVGLHVAGVLFETRRSQVNLVRAMITGRKELPGPGE